MKSLFKNPLFYLNVFLLAVIFLLVISVNVNQMKFPTFIKKAIAAVQSITGAGSVNYLAAFSGTNQIGNSIIYDNGTNVGIGTVNPRSKLHVSGNILADGDLDANGGTVSASYDVNAARNLGAYGPWVYAPNGNMWSNDYYINAIGKWASQLMTTTGTPRSVYYCPVVVCDNNSVGNCAGQLSFETTCFCRQDRSITATCDYVGVLYFK